MPKLSFKGEQMKVNKNNIRPGTSVNIAGEKKQMINMPVLVKRLVY